MTNILFQFIFNERISFQKPFKDRDIFTKVIKAEVIIAIKAETKSFQVVLFDIIVLFSDSLYLFLRKRLEYLIKSGILS